MYLKANDGNGAAVGEPGNRPDDPAISICENESLFVESLPCFLIIIILKIFEIKNFKKLLIGK